jgi:outer membrane receptor protein involved in Fe transport
MRTLSNSQTIVQSLGLGFLLLPIAFSQAAEQIGIIETPAVEVIGHYDNSIATYNSASSGQITSGLIENRPRLRNGELLEFVPGMIATQHSGEGKANQYYLRGFNLDHGTDFATFIDGMPVNMPNHAHGQGYTDLNFIIPELVTGIDYKKGPYFADEGDFSSAGTARMALANKLQKGFATLTAGSYDYQRVVVADSIELSAGNLLYGIEINHKDGPWRQPENLQKFSALLRFSDGGAHDGFSVTAMAYKNQWNATDQIPLRALNAGSIRRYDSIDPSNGGDTERVSLSFTRHHTDKNGRLDLNAYVVQSSLDLYSNFTYFLNDPAQGDQFNQSEKRQLAGLNLSRSWYSRIGDIDMQNKLGLLTRIDNISPVALYNTASRRRTSLVRSDQVQQVSAGIYAENSAQWTHHFRSVLGIRYDHYHFNVHSSIVGNSGKEADGIVSPKLSLIFGPWHKTEYFINYGKSFHSNDARGTTQTRLTGGEISTSVTPLVATEGKEIGLRTEIIPGLQSSFVLWQLDLDSELIFVGDAGETEASRPSRRYGVEWNNHYQLNDWMLLDLDFAASRAKFSSADASGNFIPGAVNKVASVGVTINNWKNWHGGFHMRYLGSRPLIEDNSVRSKPTTLGYARLGYKFDQHTSLNLDIFNVFNRKASDIDYFYTSRLSGEPASGVDDIHFHPVAPRNFRLSLNYFF